MATFRLRYFSRPDTLRSIAPSRLLELLDPYREVLAAAGCALPAVAREDLVPYQRLGELLAATSEALPADLLNVLYLVDEMATPEGADALLEAVFEENLPLDTDQEQTPADVAVQVWLRRPALLERKHAERMTLRPRTFEYYQTAREDAARVQRPIRVGQGASRTRPGRLAGAEAAGRGTAGYGRSMSRRAFTRPASPGSG
jgi:hypothetical protein